MEISIFNMMEKSTTKGGIKTISHWLISCTNHFSCILIQMSVLRTISGDELVLLLHM